jgi:hypothetical protein
MALPVLPAELARAFASHRASAQDALHPDAEALLLFYAIECGLKARLLLDRQLRDTAALDDGLRTHDLKHLVRTLRVGADAFPGQAWEAWNADLAFNRGRIPIHQWHEAWRYGAADFSVEGETSTRAKIRALGYLARWLDEQGFRR